MITLRDDQLEALDKMHNGCILCGDTGSGKSLVSLAYYYKENGGVISNGQMRKLMPKPQNLVIITTAAKRDKHEWEHELLSILMAPGCGIYSNHVVIDSWNNIGRYIATSGAFFIFDEQRVSGSGAWVKSFYKITSKNNWILLSATPGDRWEDYIPVFVANGFYRNKTQFSDEHLIYDHHVSFPKVRGYLGEKKLERLRAALLIDIDYVPHTVPHHETIIVGYDRDLYRRIMRERVVPWETIQVDDLTFQKPIENASEFCITLRKVLNSGEERLEYIDKIVRDFPRVIIFYNFDFELDILKKHDWGRVIGEWNGHQHNPIPKSDKWVYLVQYNAGNEGWNCIETNCMIFYSENYSYRIMKQASGRINRANTRYVDLYYWHFRTTAGIDLQINRALLNKKKFNEGAFYRRIRKE